MTCYTTAFYVTLFCARSCTAEQKQQTDADMKSIYLKLSLQLNKMIENTFSN